jgi:hypothetical protein
MDYEKKYLKYKSKYNLKKSSLLGGMGEKIMKGGNIDAIAYLVSRDVPMIKLTDENNNDIDTSNTIVFLDNRIQTNGLLEENTPSNIKWHSTQTKSSLNLSIDKSWESFIQFSTISDIRKNTTTITFREGINPNSSNSQGKKLLYLAAQNCNKQMFDALVAMGAGVTDINRGGHSNILHGIAWGKVNDQGHPIKTYDEKVAFIQYILQRYPEASTLLFQKNVEEETWHDNLLMLHPNKISKSLEHVAFPVKTIRDTAPKDGVKTDYYVNNQTNVSTWQRPY